MQHDLFPFLSSLLPALGAIQADSWAAEEDDNELTISLDMPGFEKGQIQVLRHGGKIDVTASNGKEGKGARSYAKSFVVSESLDSENADATYEKGVLEIRLKYKEEKKSRKIEIR